MKIIITLEPGEADYDKDEYALEDAKALLNASNNQTKIDSLYDEVFRPVIRYSQDAEKANAFALVWEEVSKYFAEE